MKRSYFVCRKCWGRMGRQESHLVALRQARGYRPGNRAMLPREMGEQKPTGVFESEQQLRQLALHHSGDVSSCLLPVQREEGANMPCGTGSHSQLQLQLHVQVSTPASAPARCCIWSCCQQDVRNLRQGGLPLACHCCQDCQVGALTKATLRWQLVSCKVLA